MQYCTVEKFNMFVWVLASRPLILFEGVPGRIASGVFFLEVSLALVGVASPAYFQ
jgi:hypothetical protein